MYASNKIVDIILVQIWAFGPVICLHLVFQETDTVNSVFAAIEVTTYH